MQGLRVAGHPLHPALVHFPIAAWTAAWLGDLAYLFVGDALWWRLSYWAIVAGVVTGLAAMTAGLVELTTMGARHPAMGTALRHMAWMGSAWAVFTLDLVLRQPGTPAQPPVLWLLVLLSFAGWLLLLPGGYLGARLVYEYGVGQTHPGDS